MRMNETRTINNIQLTKEEQDFLIDLWKVAENWTELGYNYYSEDDIRTTVGDIIGFLINNEQCDGIIKMDDIV